MRILWGYLVVRFVAAFVAALGVLLLTIVVVEMLRDLGEILDREGGLRGAAEYVLFRVPSYYLPYLVPASGFVAALFTMGTAARSREFLAMKAGGVDPLQAIAPVLLAGVALSGLAFVLNETVAVGAARAWNERVRGQEGEVELRRGTFWYHGGRFVFNIRDADPAARTVGDVAVFELDDEGRLLRRIEAPRARLGEGSLWIFEKALVRAFDPAEPAAEPRFEEHAEYAVELPGDPNVADLDAEVGTLSVRGLSRYVEDRARAGGDVTRARARFHARITSPLSAFVFVLLAIPIGLRVEQSKSMARAALQGVAVLTVFYLVRESGANLARGGVMAGAATPWIVLALFSAVGVWRLSRVSR